MTRLTRAQSQARTRASIIDSATSLFLRNGFQITSLEQIGEEGLKKFAEAVPFPKRLGSPDEYASLARHLLENTYINGEVVRMDGAQRFQPR